MSEIINHTELTVRMTAALLQLQRWTRQYPDDHILESIKLQLEADLNFGTMAGKPLSDIDESLEMEMHFISNYTHAHL